MPPIKEVIEALFSFYLLVCTPETGGCQPIYGLYDEPYDKCIIRMNIAIDSHRYEGKMVLEADCKERQP